MSDDDVTFEPVTEIVDAKEAGWHRVKLGPDGEPLRDEDGNTIPVEESDD